jgi:hypothetical protein
LPWGRSNKIRTGSGLSIATMTPALRQNQLLDAAAIRQAVIAQDAAVVPELGDEGGGGGHGGFLSFLA